MTHREIMTAYLLMKVGQEDWHGVADAAMDLRDIDAEALGYKKGYTDGINEH